MTSQNAYDLIYQITGVITLNRADGKSVEEAFGVLKALVDEDMAPKDEPQDGKDSDDKQPEQPAESASDTTENKDVAASVEQDKQPAAPVDGPAVNQGPVNL